MPGHPEAKVCKGKFDDQCIDDGQYPRDPTRGVGQVEPGMDAKQHRDDEGELVQDWGPR